ncbi:MAG TPA: Type 1 glutamine amidotransferase-like domain-containing protein [Holophaga sp.]|nr:Type 1 glutamine amidotransferase-like domain-containing protein [Holophaga sp.]
MQAKLRLALYSDQQEPGNPAMDRRLAALLGMPRPRIGYVASGPDPDRRWYQRKVEHYARLGMDMTVFQGPGDPAGADDLLWTCDGIHLSGGNTFAFLGWLREQGVLPRLRQYALEGGVLIGESAGAILMTPDARSAALCGDEAAGTPEDAQALGLVPFRFWPHAGSGTGPARQAILQPFPDIFACPDGSGIIVDGASIETFGPVRRLGLD